MGRGVMAYETFAFVYDEVMDSSLYKKWLDFSCRHLGKRKQLLELACGTGALAVEFAKAGFDVTGLDLSEEMLMIASQRAEKEEAAVQFVAGDMLDFVDVGTYQAITCYSDSLCYMEDEQSVQQVFDGVYSCLEEDGVFLFDVHSLYQIDEVFPFFPFFPFFPLLLLNCHQIFCPMFLSLCRFFPFLPNCHLIFCPYVS